MKILGGLGNQMFQYAFYKALKRKFPCVKADTSDYKKYPLHNGFELERIFRPAISYAGPLENWFYGEPTHLLSSRARRKLFGNKSSYYEEKTFFHFDEKIFSDKNSRYYWGYWQNEKYFKDFESELRSDFTFTIPLSGKNSEMSVLIQASASVSVHVRRGDYIGNSLLALTDLSYYQRAIDHIHSIVKDPVFFIFSDEIEWCRENLQLSANCFFIDWNKKSESYIDMQLMSQCKHNIISNSSFSWWAAWLNINKEKKIITPTRWFNNNEADSNDLIPVEWIRI